MNMGHLHLMLNHLPVLAAPALLALLAYGLWRRLPEVTRLALWCTAALGMVTLLVYFTGEAEEEMIEALPAFDHDLVAGLVIGTLVTMVTAWTGGPIGHPEIRP